MNETTDADILAEVWEAKDSLSAKFGHDLAATCRALYAEQAKHPERFVSLGKPGEPREAVGGEPGAQGKPTTEVELEIHR